jgi:hypothetical protein
MSSNVTTHAVTKSQQKLIDLCRKCDIPVTRENYIAANWGEPLPEWTRELEAELPEELQDWSLFETVGDQIVLKDG